MIKAFLIIRLKQAYRALSEIGIFRVIVLLSIISFLFYWFFSTIFQKTYTTEIALIYIAILFFLHLKRQDLKFLKIHFHKYRLVLFVENLLLSLPLLFGLLFIKDFITFFAVLVAISLLINTHLKIKKRSWNSFLLKKIPQPSFEWSAGVRRFYIPIIVIWSTAAIFAFYIATVPILIYVLGIIIITFYEKCEPIQMVLVFEKSPKSFLIMKIKKHLTLLSVFMLPLMAIFALFHPELWYIPVAEFVILNSLILYLILLKYAFYIPNSKPVAAQVFVILGSLALIVPFFIPLVWITSIHFYFKSINNLKFYLDDYN